MKEFGVKDAHALQSYFIQRMGKFLSQKGRASSAGMKSSKAAWRPMPR